MIRRYGGERARTRADKADGKSGGHTTELDLKLVVLRMGEAGGIPSVGVKGVDIRRNTSGEGGLLDDN